MKLLKTSPASDSQESAQQASATDSTSHGRQKKNRPTPKRKQAQAQRMNPVVPKDRKAAKRADRRRRDEEFERQRQAMITGDERYLPARDKGRVRRYVRDYIDARYSVGELFLPITLLMLVAMLIIGRTMPTTNASLALMIGIYAWFTIAIIDAVIAWSRVRTRLAGKFDEDEINRAGHLFFYVFSRCFQLRRWRQPVPMVQRRQFPK